MTKAQKITYRVLKALLSALFLFSAYSKLTGDPMAAAGFAQVGLPIWFMYVIGAGELLGAIGLWVRPLFRYAYEGLFVVLIGAVVTTAVYVSALLALLPLVSGVVLGIVVWLHGKEMPVS